MSYFAHSSQYRRRWLKTVLFALAEFAVIIIIVLLVNASHIRLMAAGTGMQLGLGPMHLMYIEKSAAPGGYSLTFSLSPNLGLLLLICFAIEAMIMWKFSRLAKKTEPSDDI